ncbi:MAG: hypothetical protein WC569_04020 [Candidatus Omnitrophota bacterium]
MLNSYLIPFLLSFSLSIILTPLIKRIAVARGYVAKPREDRWHKKPTALFGGIAIFVSFLIPYIIFIKFTIEDIGMILCGCFIFGLGLFDDIVHIKPYSKLLGQILIASLLVTFGVYIKVIPYAIVSVPVTIFWMLAIINSFNLLDNMDGLSGGIAAIVSLVLFTFTFLNNNIVVALPSLIMAGALLGFLRYNYNPAQIFMGDCGSMFVGFILGAIALQGSWKEPAHLLMMLAVPILVLAVPIFDTIFVSVMRGINSRRIFQGGKDHLSHRMVVLGLSEKKAVYVLYFISVIFGVISIVSIFVNFLITTVLILLAVIILVYFAVFLGKVKVYEVKEAGAPPKRNGNGNVVLNSIILHKRRILEVGVDFILICASYISANLLRFEGVLSAENQDLIFRSMPIILIIKYVVFFKFGLYRGIWRYVGVSDLIDIFKAVSSASLASMAAILLIWRFQDFSRAVFVIDWLLLFVFISGARVLERVYKEIFDRAHLRGKRVLIYGAGDAGEYILRELKNNKMLNYEPVGFLDDDEEKTGRRIHGIAVLGSRKDMERIMKRREVDELIIAIPALPKDVFEEVVKYCNSVDVSCKRMFDILPK